MNATVEHLVGPHRAHQPVDFILKAADLGRHRAGDAVDLVHQVGCLARIMGDFGDVAGDLPGAGRGFQNASADFPGRGGLLLDRGGDTGGDRLDLVDDADDGLDAADRLFGFGLDTPIWAEICSVARAV